MPEIHDLSVSSDYFRFPGFRSVLQGMIRNSSITKLRSCNLCLDLLSHNGRHLIVVEVWDSVPLSLLEVPDIQSITVVPNLRAEAISQLRLSTTSITRLDLHHCQTRDMDLSFLLAATPHLKYLKYHARSDHTCLSPTRGFKPIPGHVVGLESSTMHCTTSIIA